LPVGDTIPNPYSQGDATYPLFFTDYQDQVSPHFTYSINQFAAERIFGPYPLADESVQGYVVGTRAVMAPFEKISIGAEKLISAAETLDMPLLLHCFFSLCFERICHLLDYLSLFHAYW
jgi:hypothetical protein